MKEARTVTAAWVRTHFEEVVDHAVNANEYFIVEDNNTPAVVILSLSEYEQLKRQADLSRYFNSSQHSPLEIEHRRFTEAEKEAELKIIKQQVYGK